MSEDFLNRIRVQPPPEFLARLKSKLDRQPLQRRASPAHTLFAGLLAGASALALASLALRGELAGLHWSGWGGAHLEVSHGAAGGGPEAGTSGAAAPPQGWANSWAPVSGQTARAGSQGREGGNGAGSVVAIPPGAATVPRVSSAQYNRGATPPAPERLRIAVTLHAESYTEAIANRFVAAGFSAPQISVAPIDRLLGNLCADKSIDLATVTRRITQAERVKCTRSGTSSMVEIKHGYHAIALVRSKLYGPLSLSPRDIYLALARMVPDPANPGITIPNPYSTWNQLDPALPSDHIQVFGPSLASEEGQTFVTLFVEAGCNTFATMAALQSVTAHDEACRMLREDGVYTQAPPGYADQKLAMLPAAIGVIPYSTLALTVNLVPNAVNGVQPSLQSIADGTYAGARTLYLYVNRERARRLTSMRMFLGYFLEGVDTDFPVGSFIPLPRPQREEIRAEAFTALGYQP